MLQRLADDVPAEATAQKDFFEPDISRAKKSDHKFYLERASVLRNLLVYRSPVMPTGALSFCFEYAAKDGEPLPGIYRAVRTRFADFVSSDLPVRVRGIYEFRNTYVAHEKRELTDGGETEEALKEWITALVALSKASMAQARTQP